MPLTLFKLTTTSGKTTSFYTVCGLVQPTSGEVFFDDLNITKYPDENV